MRTPSFAQLVLFCALSATLTAAEPLPDKAALEAAQRLVRDTYRDELTSEAGLKKILEEADGLTSVTDRAAAYLVVARQAAASGWLRVGFAAIERLARRFDYDAPAAKVSMLEGAVKRAKTVEERVSIVNRCLELLEEAVSDERFDVGDDAMKIASGVGLEDPRRRLAEGTGGETESVREAEEGERRRMEEAGRRRSDVEA